MSDNSNHWERQLLEKLASAALVEQRRARQWKIFFRMIWLIIIGFILFSLFMRNEDKAAAGLTGSGHSAVITLEGVIDSQSDTANKLSQALADAYGDKNTKGIIIDANSPAAARCCPAWPMTKSAARRSCIRPSRSTWWSTRYARPAATTSPPPPTRSSSTRPASSAPSACCPTASASPPRWKNWGDRRLRTSGENKAMGDPFSPVNPKQEAIRQQLLDDIHAQFIAAVKAGRGQRLANDPQLFSGMVWLGEKSIPLGLADGLGTVRSVARDMIKAEKTVDYTQQDDLSSRVARKIGVEFAGGVKSLFDTKLF